MSDLLLPSAARLVHIGPPKTATTSLQAAFHAARDDLAAYGVRYAGEGRHAMLAAIAAAGGRGFLGGPQPEQDHWADLVAEIKGAGDQRVVLSSEFLAQARRKAVRRIVTDLGADALHVVLTLRPLHAILPSQWQQYVQTGYDVSYDEWLTEMFSGAPRKGLTPSFWVRHRHDELAARWAEVVGADHVTVVVLDPTDREAVLRVFEQMVALPTGTLALHPNLSNRSLTYGEAEIVRAFNTEFRRRELPEEAHFSYFRNGSVARMRARMPGPDEPRITTPAWALERVADVTEEVVAAIASMGVQVVGDLSSLVCQRPGPGAVTAEPDDRVPSEVAALPLVGAIMATSTAEERRAARRAWRPADELTTRQLAGLLRRRATRRLRVQPVDD